MKISELIKKLQHVQKNKGDLVVYSQNYGVDVDFDVNMFENNKFLLMI